MALRKAQHSIDFFLSDDSNDRKLTRKKAQKTIPFFLLHIDTCENKKYFNYIPELINNIWIKKNKRNVVENKLFNPFGKLCCQYLFQWRNAPDITMLVCYLWIKKIKKKKLLFGGTDTLQNYFKDSRMMT